VLRDVGAYRDGLVGRFPPAHVVVVNPATTVRGPRHEAVAGKTLQTSVEQAPTKAAIP